MVLRRHAAVLWRFRTIILTGFFLGLTVAVLAVAKVSTSGIEWRAPGDLVEHVDAVRDAAGLP